MSVVAGGFPHLSNLYFEFVMKDSTDDVSQKIFMKQYNLALKDFKVANKLDADDASHYKGLGLANAALGKAKAAITAFEKAKHLKAASEKRAN